MAAMFLLLLFSTFHTAKAQYGSANISLGSSLSPITNSSWLSSSGKFAFGFYPQGNGFLVGIWIAKIPEKTVVWTANRDDPTLSRDVKLLLTVEGSLILQLTDGREKSIAATPQSASSASMLDSGNFVLYDSQLKIMWQSFNFPTDTLLPSQQLAAGRILYSSVSETNHSTGKFQLIMQKDGNLVQYPVVAVLTPADAYWSSRTYTAGDNVTLNLGDDGHLYLLNNTGFNIYNLTSGGFPANQSTIYRMTMDVDGIFRLYSSFIGNNDWSIEWSSSSDKCVVKGRCGLNGYCTIMDQQSVCRCPPGFDFIDQVQQDMGCQKNSTSGDCQNQEVPIKYTMYKFENTIWEDNPYAIFNATNQDCMEACLGDCNCEVALFQDGKCKKQRLPMRYGRRKLDNSTTAFVKVGIGSTKDIKYETKTRRGILITSVLLIGCAIIVLVLTGILIYRHRVWTYRKISKEGSMGLTEDYFLRSFSYDELEKVTEGFKEELGKGAFGTVFKGTLNDHRVVAVKRLENVVNGGERDFKNEMRAIAKTHHKYLIRLLGYCHDGQNRLLVYEYMSNGSLADFIFRLERHPSWDERVRISLGIARGILYLHEECETQIIHCDIKAQNILMDKDLCPKIADFGLAKLLKPDQTKTFTGVRGTRGYVAPEWHWNMPITVKVDVYSFGVVLLEIICCRKNLDTHAPDHEIVLVNWAYDCFERGELSLLNADADLDKKTFERIVKVGLWCIQDEPSLRPPIKKVVLMLEGTVDIPVPPSPTSFLSAILASTE
ncbi:G-type lectin S-receptor-like serine/threonine-protein kinase LECRK3 [Telopea speciosissima]|uniref:G-type lectin S-receptor-like serine/threonine-protein kinase LECRK3 n=1 Tax=Telopea speciosissima TaxID=54955 RepID=UPI001CC72745|nr:G-type lectin S-receptor-like serine/threonine-protein kinase LECRK3 [Telopea speciosissima]